MALGRRARAAILPRMTEGQDLRLFQGRLFRNQMFRKENKAMNEKERKPAEDMLSEEAQSRRQFIKKLGTATFAVTVVGMTGRGAECRAQPSPGGSAVMGTAACPADSRRALFWPSRRLPPQRPRGTNGRGLPAGRHPGRAPLLNSPKELARMKPAVEPVKPRTCETFVKENEHGPE